MIEHMFHPFDTSKKMCWNLWWPGVVKLNHLSMDECVCLMLDRNSGKVYTKPAQDVTIYEWNQMAGGDAVIAVASEKECF